MQINEKTLAAIRSMDTETLRRRLEQCAKLDTSASFRKGAKEHLKKKAGGRVSERRLDNAAESLARAIRSELATRTGQEKMP